MSADTRVPYAMILAAKSGDGAAMAQILRHYRLYIAACSRRKLLDEYDNEYIIVDEEIKNRIEAKLMYQIIYDFDPCRLPGESVSH